MRTTPYPDDYCGLPLETTPYPNAVFADYMYPIPKVSELTTGKYQLVGACAARILGRVSAKFLKRKKKGLRCAA